MTTTKYTPGMRVQRGYSGEIGTVTGVTATRVNVAYDNGGTDSQPIAHGAFRVLPAADSHWRDETPAAMPDDAHWTDTVVCQGHADYCAAWGHAAGSFRCPRCGEVLPTPDVPPLREYAPTGTDPGEELYDADETVPVSPAYSFYVGSAGFFDARTGSAAAYAIPRELRIAAHDARDIVTGVWDGDTEETAVYQLNLSDDARAQRIAYAMAIATGNDSILVTRDIRPGERDSAMSSIRRFIVSTERATTGNRTLYPGNPEAGYRFVPDARGDEVAFLVNADATVSAVQ